MSMKIASVSIFIIYRVSEIKLPLFKGLWRPFFLTEEKKISTTDTVKDELGIS